MLIVLNHRLTASQLSVYERSRLIEPSVLSLRPTMVFLNNAHYPNAILHARITYHIRDFFNAIDHVVQDVHDNADEEEGNDPNAGNEGGQEEEGEE